MVRTRLVYEEMNRSQTYDADKIIQEDDSKDWMTHSEIKRSNGSTMMPPPGLPI